MKNQVKMKNVMIIVLSLIISSAMAQTKPFRVPFSGQGKKVLINIQQTTVEIEGYDGADVILEQTGENRKELPKEAEGLRLFTDGVVDNTGLGANVEVEGSTLKITVPKNKYAGVLIIKVPKNLNLNVTETQGWGTNKLTISDIAGEIEVESFATKLFLNDITGPLVANNQKGRIFVSYTKVNQSSPSSIHARDAIDITLPADTKANLKIKSYYGDLFTDLDIVGVKKEVKENASASTSVSGKVAAVEKTGVVTINGEGQVNNKVNINRDEYPGQKAYAYVGNRTPDNFEGTINGGGVTIDLKSSNGNIYVRKKK